MRNPLYYVVSKPGIVAFMLLGCSLLLTLCEAMTARFMKREQGYL